MTRMPVLNPLKRGMLIFLVSALLPVLLYALLDWLTNARFSFGDPDIGWCWDLACGGIVVMAIIYTPTALAYAIILEMWGWRSAVLGQLCVGFIIGWILIAIEVALTGGIAFAVWEGFPYRIMLLQLFGLLAGNMAGYLTARKIRLDLR